MIKVDVHPEFAKKPTPLPCSEEHFAGFYRECRGFVRSVLLRRGRVEEREADDLTQEVFLVAWRRRDGLVWGPRTRPWLYVVALYVAANHRKLSRNHWETPTTDLPDPPIHPRTPQAIDAARLLSRLLRKLGKKLAPVLIAYEIEGRTMPDIAHALGIRLKTAYARLQLARNRLAPHAPR